MGKCITIIKVIGATSLGIATGTATYTSFQILPTLIENQSYTVSALSNLIKKTIIQTRVALLSFGSIATTALLLAFNQSNVKGRHPYLIYAALGFPLSLISYFYQSYQNEENLLKISENAEKVGATGAGKTTKKQHLESALDNSVYQDLGRTSSQEEDDDSTVEEEVNNAIIKKESSAYLNQLKVGYNIIAGFTGAAFAIATVGLIGDRY